MHGQPRGMRDEIPANPGWCRRRPSAKKEVVVACRERRSFLGLIATMNLEACVAKDIRVSRVSAQRECPAATPRPDRVVDREPARKKSRLSAERSVQATIRSHAGSPTPRQPKSMTALSRPCSTSRFPEERPPWIQTGGRCHSGYFATNRGLGGGCGRASRGLLVRCRRPSGRASG
jgi:hypothetical protein